MYIHVVLYIFYKHIFCFSIDASTTVCLARMVNDVDKFTKANCIIKKIIVNNAPHLCIFALRDINKDDELRYDYGEKNTPWRKRKVG